MSISTPARIPRYSIALVSFCALAYEILLMRLFSIIQWHHFAYMIISLALLGYGVSGTFLALTQHRLLRHFRGAYAANVALFGLSAVGCFLFAQRIQFNPQEILWDMRQPLRLAAIYLLLAVPFFFAANAIALALTYFRENAPRVYAADLVGAGLGSLGVIGLLYVVFPSTALPLLGALALTAAALAWWELRARPRFEGWAFLFMALVVLGLPGNWTTLRLSPYKALENTLRVEGAEVVAERSSPLGLLSVVQSPKVPFRHAPGLSLQAPTEPPEQVGIFTDGGNMTAVTRYTGDPQPIAYLDWTTAAAPYHLRAPDNVLVLGAGGGSDVLQALYHGVAHVDAVELNPQIVELVRTRYEALSGYLYNHDRVTVHTDEARGFVSSHAMQYDLIQLTMLDGFAASSAGLYALNESYLYTVEGLQAYLRRLAPGGYLAISRWIKLPPRDNLKLFATAVEALRGLGVAEPGRRMALVRNWQTGTLIIKNGALGAGELEGLRRFADSRAFDLAWYPGMPAAQANRHNVFREPYLYEGALALLGPGAEGFQQRYKFNIAPATDDRPYFFHFFKWDTLPEVLALRGRGGASLLEWGYLVLGATLAQAIPISLVLILVPLVFGRGRSAEGASPINRLRVLVYFLAVGLAFLFIEIAFIQKFILFLHHPLYAAGVMLTGFLIFAGLGSFASDRIVRGGHLRRGVVAAIVGILVIGLAYTLALDPIFDHLGGLGTGPKVALSLALVAPLAFCMGMPFPVALASLGRHGPHLIPWAWGVNGCASVISAVGATLLAIHFGFTLVVWLALGLYVIVALSFPQPRPPKRP